MPMNPAAPWSPPPIASPMPSMALPTNSSSYTTQTSTFEVKDMSPE